MISILLALSLLIAGGRPPIVDAAKNGDKDSVRTLLKQPANINAADADGTTALHWASYHDDAEVADMLIRAGAKVNVTTDLGVSPLWTASQNGSAPMVARLLAAGANPNTALLSGETPIMVASRTGSAAVVEQLIAKGGNVNAHGTRGQTALMWAVSEKHPEVVKVLLAHGVDLNAKSDTWSQLMAVDPYSYPPYNMMVPHGGETALMFAARVGDLDSAKLLIAAGAKASDEDAWGVSATTLAEHSGFSELARFLIEKGGNPNASKAGFTALHVAIMWRDEKTVASLLEHGADPNIPLRTWTPNRRSGDLDRNFEPELVGASPLWLAARFLQPGVMDLLVKHGADAKFVHHSEKVTEARNGVVTATGTVEALVHKTDATTTLMAAVGMGSGTPWVQAERADKEKLTLDAVKVVVESGIDVNATAPDGRTALDGAKTLRFDSVTNYLVSKGAITGAAKKAATK